ncbi:replication initiation protein [Escherichia coli]
MGADTGYSGLICKNPNHSHWKIARMAARTWREAD